MKIDTGNDLRVIFCDDEGEYEAAISMHAYHPECSFECNEYEDCDDCHMKFKEPPIYSVNFHESNHVTRNLLMTEDFRKAFSTFAETVWKMYHGKLLIRKEDQPCSAGDSSPES